MRKTMMLLFSLLLGIRPPSTRLWLLWGSWKHHCLLGMVVLILVFLACLTNFQLSLFLSRKYRLQHLHAHIHRNHIPIHMHSCLKILSHMPKYIIDCYLLDCFLQTTSLMPEFTTDIDICSFCSHGETNNEGSFNKFMRVTS